MIHDSDSVGSWELDSISAMDDGTPQFCHCQSHPQIQLKSSTNTLKVLRLFQIVGLGNCDLPHTRHSVGMTLVDHLANLLDATWLKNRDVHGKVSHATVTTADGRDMVELVLLKSRLPMNLNGRSVRKAGQCNAIVIHLCMSCSII